GRGVGGRVSCPRPLPWRYPTGFAGMCFATASGLGVWWAVRWLLVVALWRGLVPMARALGVFEHVRGRGRVCWPSFRSPGCLLVADFCVFEGVAAPAGRRLGRLGRLGCLLVGDLCGAGVGLLSVRGCGLRWWPLTWSSRVTVRRGLRV